MSGISHLKQPIQTHFPGLLSKAKPAANNEILRNRTIVTSPIEQLFLGNGDYWDDYLGTNPVVKTLVGFFLSAATIGVAPIAIFIHQWCNENYAQPNQDNDTKENVISQLGINDPRIIKWLRSLSAQDATLVGEFLDQFHRVADDMLANILSGNEVAYPLFLNDAHIIIQVRKDGIYLKQDDKELLLLLNGEFLNNFPDWFKDINLSGLDLAGVNLESADLAMVQLHSSGLSYANLTEGNMQSAILCGANLFKAKLFGTNLSLANLRNASLFEADFRGAILSSAKLLDVQIIGAKFNGAVMDKKTEITLALPEVWDYELLALYLNHLPIKLVDVYDEETERRHQIQRLLMQLQQHKTGSILTAIDSIDDMYFALKLKLIHQVLASLKNIDTSSVDESMMVIFNGNVIYKNDFIIKEFMSNAARRVKQRRPNLNVEYW